MLDERSSLAVASVAARTAYHTQNSTINAMMSNEGRNADIEPIKNHQTMQSSSNTTAIANDSKPVPDTTSNKREHERELEKLQGKHSKLISAYKYLAGNFNEQLDALRREKKQHKKEKNRCTFFEEVATIMLNNCVRPYAAQQELTPKSWTESTIDEVSMSLCRDVMEATSLRAQVESLQDQLKVANNEVRVLQNDMLAKVEKVKAATDEELAREFCNLVSLIKTFTREVRTTGEESDIDILCSGIMLKGVARHHWSTRARKKCLLEAWVWSVLIDSIFRSPFAIYGRRWDGLSAVWQNLFGEAHCHGWPCPTALSEAWRCTTTDQMMGVIEQGAVVQDSLKERYEYIQQDSLEVRDNIMNALHTGLKRESFAEQMPKICQIIEKAFDLAAQMSTQRSRVQVTFPSVGEVFDKDAMSAMPDPDGEDIEDGTVTFVVHPGLSKWGDANGKNLDHRYDIVPSRVQIEALLMDHGAAQVHADDHDATAYL
ncbi:hypothetical protein EJ07DRAFT_152737 [Lizonia empirigonia]|nr:hypothetical protein EJ07DRAFT_152737 [Lizonia empirigonia]